jgi:hypothetical protein
MVERVRTLPGLRREADVMGLTIALALLVALSTGNDHSPETRTDVLEVLWATTIALGLAHWFAETLSSHLVKDPNAQFGLAEMLGAQLGIGIMIAIAASIFTLLVPNEYDRLAARLTAALSVGVLVGYERRVSGSTVGRAVVWGTCALVAAVAVALVKWQVGR